MKTIWKYTLDTIEHQVLYIKKPAKVLSVSSQGNQIVLYAEVDSEADMRDKINVWIHGTGHEVLAHDTADFLGTVKLMNEMLMFHVFVL